MALVSANVILDTARLALSQTKSNRHKCYQLPDKYLISNIKLLLQPSVQQKC